MPHAKPHQAWIVLGAVVAIMVATSGLRQVFGVFIRPMEAEFHWDRATVSGVAAVSWLLLGAVSPIAGSLADRRITLELTPQTEELLGREGYDPTFGARPLKRTIQRRLQDPLALRLLNGDFTEGDTVLAGVQGGDIVFTKRVEAHAV